MAQGSWDEKGHTVSCPDCKGAGVIKHPWEMGVHLKNGELPEVKEDYPFEREETQLDMLNARYRQVVE